MPKVTLTFILGISLEMLPVLNIIFLFSSALVRCATFSVPLLFGFLLEILLFHSGCTVLALKLTDIKRKIFILYFKVTIYQIINSYLLWGD